MTLTNKQLIELHKYAADILAEIIVIDEKRHILSGFDDKYLARKKVFLQSEYAVVIEQINKKL